jgi:hypothetical protein
MGKRSNETITLGSGKLFCLKFENSMYLKTVDTTLVDQKEYYTKKTSGEGYEKVTNPSADKLNTYYELVNGIPSDALLEQEENRLAWIKGGASLEYSGEFYDAKDDLGMVSKRKLTTEDVKLKSGIMTWNGQVLKKLCSTARVTEANGVRTVKIGGTGNDDGASYIFHFLHEDPVDGDVRITMVGQNTSGFTLQFAADAETVIDAEISAVAGKLDNSGTLVIIKEEIDATA